MIRIITCLLIFRFALANSDNLTLPVYALTIDPAYISALDRDPYSDQYYPAIFVHNSVSYSCQVRYRGDTSRNLPKKSFKIKFDSNDNIFGKEILNLNAEYEDKTLMRNYLGHTLFSYLNQPAPKVKYISLKINNTFMGVYLQVEQVNEDFFESRNLDVFSCFKGYNGADMSPFLLHYLLPVVWGQKIGPSNSYDHLELFMNKITYWTKNDFNTNISNEIEVFNVLTYFALIYAVTDYDGIHKNFYFYQSNKSTPFKMITWDMDCSFGDDPDGVYHKSYETSPERGILSKHVLFLRLMEIPECQNYFWKIVSEISSKGFPYLEDLVENTVMSIRNDIYQDPLKICSNEEFETAVDQLKEYLLNRGQYLRTAMSFLPLSLSGAYCSAFDSTGEGDIIFRIKSEKQQTITLYLAKNVSFDEWNVDFDTEHFDLYDDGQHHDSSAGDLIYGNTYSIANEYDGVMPYAFYTSFESFPLHGFFYLKYHSHIGPAINLKAYRDGSYSKLRIGTVGTIANSYLVPIINPTQNKMDISHFHLQAGAYYQRVVFPVATVIDAGDTLFITSNLELVKEIFPGKNIIEHIYFDINPGDSLKILSPTYSEIYSGICTRILPLAGDLKDIVITEINYKSNDALDTGDWIEFYNPNSVPVDISDWIFQDSNIENSFLFPPDSKIQAYCTVILCQDENTFKKYQPGSGFTIGDFNFNLRQEGEYICLKNENGKIADSLTYGHVSPWPENTDGTGYTIVLKNPYLNNADGRNWQASSLIGGTPGIVPDVTLTNPVEIEKPQYFVLDQNYPNPFNTSTTIRYFIFKPSLVELKLFTINGQLIKIIEKTYRDVGCYTCSLALKNVSTGLYIYRLYLNDKPVASRKTLFIK